MVVVPGSRSLPDPRTAAIGSLALGLGLTLVLRRRDARRRAEDTLVVARALASTHDPRAGFCQAALDVMRADRAFLVEPSGPEGRLRVAALAGAPLASDVVERLEGPSLIGAAIAGGRPVFAGDAPRDPRTHRDLVRAAGARAMLAQPVRHGERVIGVLVLTWARRTRLAADRASIVELLAAAAAVSIERSWLLAAEQRAARTDPLTGVPNRRVWDRALPRELARAARAAAPLSVALLDLDRFKRFNDTHGHQAGDRLLVDAARAWRQSLRTTDLLARYGGEEFALLLPGAGADAATEAIQRLRTRTPGGQTCSAGVARWDGRESGEQLLARADRALYAAKAAGRDRVGVDDPERGRWVSMGGSTEPEG
jgi:diguanylate cyclase (GGDEF)-like protein